MACKTVRHVDDMKQFGACVSKVAVIAICVEPMKMKNTNGAKGTGKKLFCMIGSLLNAVRTKFV